MPLGDAAPAVAAEAIGGGRPVVVAPSMNTALLAHPVTQDSRRRLTSYGMTVLWPTCGNERTEDSAAWWATVITARLRATNRTAG